MVFRFLKLTLRLLAKTYYIHYPDKNIKNNFCMMFIRPM